MFGARALGAPLLAAVAIASPARALASSDACVDLLPKNNMQVGAGSSAFTARDLARIRDIELSQSPFSDAGTIALSPDGSSLAFQIRQGSPDDNRYCLAMVLLRLDGTARATILDRGGDLIRDSFDFRGKAAFPTGNASPIIPRWSPDGKWLAFLKRENGSVQIWRAAVDNTHGAQLTQSLADVEDFRIGPDGKSVIFATRPGLRRALDAMTSESLVGFRYDDRYSPMSGSRPFARAPVERTYWRQDLASNAVRPATAEEVAGFAADAMAPPGVMAYRRSSAGRAAWLVGLSPTSGSGVQLVAEGRDGKVHLCDQPSCRGRFERIWWSADGENIMFIRREGWSDETTAIYRWKPGGGAPRLLFRTDDVLANCLPKTDKLICLNETATRPVRIVEIDLRSRATTVLYDPNPEFAAFTLGQVERWRWTNSSGLPVYGDIVFPVGYRSGRRYPLIIVQYNSRGFLRGGTGDEYPIHVFANHGFVVLSLNRPISIGRAQGRVTGVDIEKVNLRDFAERRSLLSAIEVGVTRLVDQGIVDKDRIGLTGLSDGSTTLQFALVNGFDVAAAASSSGFWDPGYSQFVGPAAAREFAASGYPGATQTMSEFWQSFSIVRNADKIRTPILLQLADDEYLTSLEGFTTLRDLGRPIDMYVFAGEHHIKWQPAHRLAIYERNLDWFEFWLGSPSRRTDPGDGRFALWEQLRVQARGGKP